MSDQVVVDPTSPGYILHTLNILIDEGITHYSYDDVQMILAAFVSAVIESEQERQEEEGF